MHAIARFAHHFLTVSAAAGVCVCVSCNLQFGNRVRVGILLRIRMQLHLERTYMYMHAARKPGMTRDDLFKINAGIVKALCEGVAKTCPEVRSRVSDTSDGNDVE